MIQTTQLIVTTQPTQTLPTNNITSIAQPMVTTLPSLESIFDTTTGTTQGSSQNIEFGMFEKNVRTSNPRWQLFRNLEEGSSSARNSNYNNLSLANLFRNLGGNNFNNLPPLPSLTNLFRNLEEGNPLPNNNNLPGG